MGSGHGNHCHCENVRGFLFFFVLFLLFIIYYYYYFFFKHSPHIFVFVFHKYNRVSVVILECVFEDVWWRGGRNDTPKEGAIILGNVAAVPPQAIIGIFCLMNDDEVFSDKVFKLNSVHNISPCL